MRSILLSNIPHYHHLAEALHAEGLLSRYITTFTLLDGETAPPWLPRRLKRKLEGRRLRGVPASYVTRFRSAEVLQRALPALRLCRPDTGNWINNHLFDLSARRCIEECDVFHFVSSVGLYSAQLAKKRGARIICDVRQEHPSFQRTILEEEARRFGVRAAITGSSYDTKVQREFEIADLIVVPSQHARRTFLEAGFASEKIAALPYGVDLGAFEANPKRGLRFRILYAGSLTLRKGPQYLLEAFRLMADPAAELILAGSLDPDFKPVLARYEGSFRYIGERPKLELSELYSSASVFVLPSLADSFSLGTLEAMACGTPVIVSANTGIAEFIEDGQQGFVVPVRDAQAICEKLSYLRDNLLRITEMGRIAAARARELSWHRYGKASVLLHRQLIESANRNREQAFADV